MTNVITVVIMVVTKNVLSVTLSGRTLILNIDCGRLAFFDYEATCVPILLFVLAVMNDSGKKAIVTKVNNRILLFWLAANLASITEDAEKSFFEPVC